MYDFLSSLLSTDAGIRVACVLILAGWAVGALTVFVLGWRRLRAPNNELTLREYLRDSDAQVRDLLSQNKRLASLLIADERERAGWRGRGVA